MSKPLSPTAKRLPDELSPFFGSNGVVNTTTTGAVTGDFSCIEILNDAVFSALTENNASGDVITGLTLPAGFVLYNALGITAYTLTSGAVRAYNR